MNKEIQTEFFHIHKLPNVYRITTDAKDRCKAITKLTASKELHDANRQNISVVIQFVQQLENELSEIIAKYFKPENKDRQELFKNWIARSSALGLKVKFDIVNTIVSEHHSIKNFTNLQKQEFKNVMKYRNALAHGFLSLDDSKNEYTISYFSGAPHTEVLNSNRWEKIYEYCMRTFKLIDQTKNELSALN